MATIKEVIEDFKDGAEKTLGKNGFLYICIGIGVIFLIAYLSQDKQESASYTTATSYSSYPDAVTNANVIIDTLQDSIAYSEDNIKEYVQDSLEATNNYVLEGFEKQQELANTIYDSSMDAMSELKENVAEQIEGVNTTVSGINSTVSGLQSSVSGLQSSVSNLSTKVDTVQTSVNKVQQTANTINKTTTATSQAIKKATTKAMPKTSTNVSKTTNTIKKTNYKGVSIVDGLKSVGVNSSYAYRQQLAKANGIKNYTGTATQNTALLNKLKSGKLKKA